MRISESGLVRFDATTLKRISLTDLNSSAENLSYTEEGTAILPTIFACLVQLMSSLGLTESNFLPRINFTEAEFLQNSSTSFSGISDFRSSCFSKFLTIPRTSSTSDLAFDL